MPRRARSVTSRGSKSVGSSSSASGRVHPSVPFCFVSRRREIIVRFHRIYNRTLEQRLCGRASVSFEGGEAGERNPSAKPNAQRTNKQTNNKHSRASASDDITAAAPVAARQASTSASVSTLRGRGASHSFPPNQVGMSPAARWNRDVTPPPPSPGGGREKTRRATRPPFATTGMSTAAAMRAIASQRAAPAATLNEGRAARRFALDPFVRRRLLTGGRGGGASSWVVGGAACVRVSDEKRSVCACVG